MSAVTDVQRHVRQARVTRLAAVLGVARLAAVLGVALVALSFAVGPSPELAPTATVITTLLLLAVTQTRLIGTLRRRERELNRPRMTPEDYRRLREMEIELGWEPTEVPGSLASGGMVALEPRKPAACECGKSAEEHAREWDEQVIAKATWDDVAYASEASEHFAQLARVGLNHCLSYCPICAGRLNALMRASILAPEPDLGDVRGDLKRDLRDLSDLDGAGSGPAAPMTGPGGRWRPLSELPEIRQAGDETEGIPAGPLIENMRRELEAQRWLETERWGGNES